MFFRRDINIIIFPDWSKPEGLLSTEIAEVFKTITNHRDCDRMIVLIDSDDRNLEEIELFLSNIFLTLILKENLDITQNLEISLLENCNLFNSKELETKIHAHLILTLENPKKQYSLLPSCHLTDFSSLRPYNFFIALGRQLYQAQKWQDALFQYQKVFQENITIDPETYYQLGICYLALKNFSQYQQTLEQGIQQYPREDHFYFSLIFETQHQGKIKEAIAYAELAIARIPDAYIFKLLYTLLLPIVYQNEAEIHYYRQRFTQGLEELITKTPLNDFEKLKNAIGRVTNFYISYQAQNDRDLQKRYGNWVTQIMSANFPQWSQPLSISPLTSDRKIKIGYASAFLHSYSGTLWLTGWLKYCDRTKFEIYCYYIGNTPDKITEEFRSYSDSFSHIPFNLEAVCQQIENDRLHILVFPEIGMNPQILSIAALRLAPIQCTAWGHPVTTGLPNIDYFLSSELMEKDDADNHYSETLIRLPNIGVAYPKPQIPPLLKKRSDFQLPSNSIIYLCCQAPFKYLPQYDRIFPEIALQVPDCQFLFLRGTLLKPRLEHIFKNYHLDYLDYCIFRNIPNRFDYLTINLLSNIYLDTFTWSGGNTSLEAIACHLPIVTCPGEFMRSRHTYSFLKMIDITDTIARDEADYIKIAVRLGQEKTWRDRIAQKMKENSDRLYEDRVCVDGLEHFYHKAISEWECK